MPEVEAIACSMYGKLFRCLLYKTNNVVGVSGEITQRLSEHYPRHAKKFRTILNGVDLERFGVRSSREEVRRQLGLLPKNFVVGMVANFRKVKNHICLVRAAACLKDSCPQLRLLFVGMGFPKDTENSESEVRELTRSLQLQDKVIFAGYQETILEILAGFDAFCLPSFSEGLPVSILEAMASKVPVVGAT